MLRASTFAVLSSGRKGFSTAALVPLACGLPVFASRPRTSDVFGVSNLILKGAVGGFYPVGDVRALALKMNDQLYKDRGLDRMSGRTL